MTDAPMFELHDVSLVTDGRVLISPLTLTLAGGQVHGLIGHNGSGKSTLLKLLARQLMPDSGSLRFEGRPLKSWGAREFARRVAYLPQQPPAAAGMTVSELVALGRYPWHGALGRMDARDHEVVQSAMASTDVLRFADRLVESLSGGERQRVWLAMLIAQQARCLLLDEPTSALDIAHQLDVLGLVRELADSRGLGVVVVLHDVNMAARFCDTLLALKQGRPVASGTPATLMSPETLMQIYGVPMGVLPNPDGGTPLSYAR
ncbi:ABC transporter ATP-binding protein [Pandoraea pnomenusa]|uniref:ABC transporter ATP-binding protein n=1 Tax=Pandoraea pnomenusa TaxID=93220 RepID=UPI000AEA6DB4|nr:ATP-binding cassette domain-containing protein [Pandoraea pnomenusa]